MRIAARQHHWHAHEPTCSHAAGYEAQIGDVVTLCAASPRWRVDERLPHGSLRLVPLQGTPGSTWRTPVVTTAAHLDVVTRAPQAVLW